MMLQTNCSSEDLSVRLIALRTLNNLLPCMERHRVCDLAIATMQTNKMIMEGDELFTETLDMILNMTVFTNLQSLMIECDVLEMISHAASRALTKSDKATGLTIMKILNNLLYTSDISVSLIQQDYVPILIDVLGISDPSILK